MIPSNFVSFSGKENLLASFNHFLVDTINGGYIGLPPLPSGKEFFWGFDYPIDPQNTPSISIAEVGLFNLGETAMDRLLGHNAAGDPIYGAINQTLIEITCVDQNKAGYSQATRVVRNLRDRVVQALQTEIIPLKNFSSPSAPRIGTIRLDNESNSINEKFLVDPSNQNVRRYVILVRIFWEELAQISKIQTTISSAKIS